jgi:hypothetical protein
MFILADTIPIYMYIHSFLGQTQNTEKEGGGKHTHRMHPPKREREKKENKG